MLAAAVHGEDSLLHHYIACYPFTSAVLQLNYSICKTANWAVQAAATAVELAKRGDQRKPQILCYVLFIANMFHLEQYSWRATPFYRIRQRYN